MRVHRVCGALARVVWDDDMWGGPDEFFDALDADSEHALAADAGRLPMAADDAAVVALLWQRIEADRAEWNDRYGRL